MSLLVKVDPWTQSLENLGEMQNLRLGPRPAVSESAHAPERRRSTVLWPQACLRGLDTWTIVQLLSQGRLCETPWTAARQASLPFTLPCGTWKDINH